MKRKCLWTIANKIYSISTWIHDSLELDRTGYDRKGSMFKGLSAIRVSHWEFLLWKPPEVQRFSSSICPLESRSGSYVLQMRLHEIISSLTSVFSLSRQKKPSSSNWAFSMTSSACYNGIYGWEEQGEILREWYRESGVSKLLSEF